MSDELIDLLQQGKINIPLFCEMAAHKGFPKFLADIEIYVNRFATKMIGFLNSYVDAGRAQIMQQNKAENQDSILYLLKNMDIDEGNYFDRRIHDDIDEIIKDIRETHKGRSESASDDLQYDPVRVMESVFDDPANFKGSPSEKAVMIFCKQNQIIYSKLTDEEKLWLFNIMDKSKLLKRLVSQRGKKK
nr:hypothetical protein [Clostridia bacterium]